MDVFWSMAGLAAIIVAMGLAIWLTGDGPKDCIRAWRGK